MNVIATSVVGLQHDYGIDLILLNKHKSEKAGVKGEIKIGREKSRFLSEKQLQEFSQHPTLDELGGLKRVLKNFSPNSGTNNHPTPSHYTTTGNPFPSIPLPPLLVPPRTSNHFPLSQSPKNTPALPPHPENTIPNHR